MTGPSATSYTDFVLPPSVVSRVDIARLVAEVERADGELTAESVRASTGMAKSASVAFSTQLVEFLEQNNLSLDDSHDRSLLIKQLRLLKDKAPIVHMTFAAIADQESLQKLTQWMRASVHPQAVLAVGLQPALVAGVYVRTPNQVHDFSLRAKLKDQRALLVKELETLSGGR